MHARRRRLARIVCRPRRANTPKNNNKRYLTFWSYTLQTVLYGLATLDDVQQLRAVRSSSSGGGAHHHHHSHHHHHHHHYTRRAGLARAVDDLACATYALAHVVTLMFIAIQSTTKGAVEGGHLQRPWWLDASVHKLNVLAVHLDMMTGEFFLGGGGRSMS